MDPLDPIRSSSHSQSLHRNGGAIHTSRRSSTTQARSRFGVQEHISIAAVIVHLCKGNIGPGAMSLPYGFSRAGIYAAPVFFIVVALVSIYNMDLLLYCKRMVSPHAPLSFGEVGGKILGQRGKVVIDIFLVGTQLGFCCVYFTFVATNIHVVLPKRLQEALHERQLILLIYPVILLLSWIRTLKRITPFSGLANLAVFLGITIVFYYSLTYDPPPSTPRIPPVTVDWTQFPEFYGTAVYSFEGIGLILPIQNEMQEPHRFPRVLALVMLLILVLFLILGEVPTIAFGRINNGSMTATLHEYCEGWPVTMSNILLAFACLLSFPIQFYPAVEVLEKSLQQRSRPAADRDPAHEAQMKRLRREIELEWEHRASQLREDSPPVHTALDLLTIKSASSKASATSVLISPPLSPTKQAASSIPRCLDRLICQLSQYECNRTIFRSMLCTILMIIAVCVPDVGLLISLFGAIGSSMLAIILPPFMYLALAKHTVTWSSWLFHGLIIAFGVIGMVAGTAQALNDVIKVLQSPSN